MMCGIDEAIKAIRKVYTMYMMPENAEQIINRLDYHRAQAKGVKPKYHMGMVMKDYYTCRNCGFHLKIEDNYCPHCGYKIQWDSTRCLTGLPLVDLAEKEKGEQANG